MKHRQILLAFAFLSHTILPAQDRSTPFDPDSAAAFLRTLSVDIGPRPMGSPGEQAAMAYALDRFRAFGLDQAYILPFQIAPSQLMAGANTKSGTAVGVLTGSSDRIIVIGAHIDSYSPEGPGANDDGSGSAVVIELARVMAQRSWESTIVFCLFGGEEANLKGSFHFADTFADMDKVALMLQVDMANGSDWLLPMYDLRSSTTPAWLVHAAYEEFDKLGYEGLRYPTHFYTLNSTIGGASSDHEPFLRKGIPAIDFTTDVSDPIHTPQDSYEEFIFGGLERSGDLVYKLTERFDAGVPDEKSGHFMTMQLGRSVYLIPAWLLWALIIIAAALSMWSLKNLRGARTEKRGETWPQIPGLKLLLVTTGVMVVAVFFEDVLTLISGYRSPWFGDPWSIIPVFLSTAVFMFLLAGRLAPRLNLSNDPYRYALRSVVTLLLYTVLAALVSVRLAAYPAFALFFVSLAFVSKRGLLAAALVMLGLYPLVRLVISEVFPFMARSFALIPPGTTAAMGGIFLVLTGILIIMPFALALTGVIRSAKNTWPSFPFPPTHPAWLGLAAAAILLFSGIVVSDQPYSDRWRQKVEVTQEVTSGDELLTTTVQSGDYLSGMKVSFMSFDTVLTSNETTVKLPDLPFNRESWLQSSITRDDSTGGSILTGIHSWTRPYTLEVRYTTKNRSQGSRIEDASAGLASISLSDGNAVIQYFSFPDTSILLPVTLTLNEPDTVQQTIVATFMQPAVPVTITKEHTAVIHRTIIQETKQFFVGKPGTSTQPSEETEMSVEN